MGIFGKLFDKKSCSICGEEIGLSGNRKLEDGNMCKKCAAQLSPWFSDRRKSTVDEIKKQLAYREANREKVKQFCTSCTLGEDMKVLLDEDKGMFMVTSARNLLDENPDVLALSDITGCLLDIDENEIRFKLNRSGVESNPIMSGPHVGMQSMPMRDRTRADRNRDYRYYEELGEEIKRNLLELRQKNRNNGNIGNQSDRMAMPLASKEAVTCPWCGTDTIPNAAGKCEYCGGSLN